MSFLKHYIKWLFLLESNAPIYGNLECIGGSAGDIEKPGAGDEVGAVADGDSGGDVVEEACAGDGGDGGGGGEYDPNVMFRASSLPAPRSFSGVDSSFLADRRTATVPLILARTAALWHARDAVSAALVLFKASTGTSTGAYGLARRKKCALISERAFLPKIWDLQCPIYIVLAIEGKNFRLIRQRLGSSAFSG